MARFMCRGSNGKFVPKFRVTSWRQGVTGYSGHGRPVASSAVDGVTDLLGGITILFPPAQPFLVSRGR
jgi:hypothetical protein